MSFLNKSVPVAIAAKVYGKDPSWIRAGLICGWLPIGFATRNGKVIDCLEDLDVHKGRINYYISSQQLFEKTGFSYEEYCHDNYH